MTLIKHGFTILPENELTYMSHFQGIVDSIDELASVEVRKTTGSYAFRIVTSTPAYSQPLLQALLEFHNLLHVKINMSKSMKKSSTISFLINLN